MAIAKGGIAAVSMAETLRARIASLEIRVAGIWKRRAHEFIRAAGILAVTENHRFGRMRTAEVLAGFEWLRPGRGRCSWCCNCSRCRDCQPNSRRLQMTGIVEFGRCPDPPTKCPAGRWRCRCCRKSRLNPSSRHCPCLRRPSRRWDRIGVVIRINVRGDSHLAQVAQTLNAFGFRFTSCQRGQKHRRENRNDRDDHQKFNQGKAGISESAFA